VPEAQRILAGGETTGTAPQSVGAPAGAQDKPF
jgi:hypothetical protein